MIRSRDSEHTTGQMAGSTKATGMTENNMEKANSRTAKESASMANGIMESVFVG
jgi:hypothetical protein